MRFLPAVAVLAQACNVSARAVFAHFMWEHATQWSVDRWKQEIVVAQTAHIDAFAMNLAFRAEVADNAMANAFTAARDLGFKLFISLDYAGNGLWPKDRAQRLIQWANGQAAVYRHNGKPLVSTFEGWERAGDFWSIKADTGIFFCPDWSSRGAAAAASLEGGVADCLFSWAAWPEGNRAIDRASDDSYRAALGSKPYMMPVSPWFFTNLPGYNKNWLWKGDTLWYDRWTQILSLPDNLLPEFIQIISWNDYAESHYIGPLTEDGFPPFQYGGAPYNYARDMPHYRWRDFLPYVIDNFKLRQRNFPKEGIQVWNRETMGRTCATGGTTGNTAQQGQREYAPYELLSDNVFVAALCSSNCRFQYRIGNGAWTSVGWRITPAGGLGVYQGQIPMTSAMVNQALSWELHRVNGGLIVGFTATRTLKNSCINGISNWNAVVEGKMT